MPTRTERLPAPTPITAEVRNARGTVDVHTDPTSEVVVELSARHDDDLEGITVQQHGEHLLVDVPKRRLGRQPRVGIVVRVPVGSRLVATTASARVSTIGPLAEATVTTASGGIRVDEVTGSMEAQAASGAISVGSVGGTLVARTASGAVRVDSVTGRAEVRTASGAVGVHTAGHDLVVRTASGAIRVGEVAHGQIDLTAVSGSVRVGVRPGRLVWLDLSSVSGSTRSDLADDEGPEGGEDVVRITARTVSGSIRVEPVGAPSVTA